MEAGGECSQLSDAASHPVALSLPPLASALTFLLPGDHCGTVTLVCLGDSLEIDNRFGGIPSQILAQAFFEAAAHSTHGAYHAGHVRSLAPHDLADRSHDIIVPITGG